MALDPVGAVVVSVVLEGVCWLGAGLVVGGAGGAVRLVVDGITVGGTVMIGGSAPKAADKPRAEAAMTMPIASGGLRIT